MKGLFLVFVLCSIVLVQSCKTTADRFISNETDLSSLYESPQGDFTFELPNSWISSYVNRDSTMLVFHQDTVNMINLDFIHVYITPSDSITFNSYLKSEAEKLKAEHKDFSLIDSNPLFINELKSVQINYTYYMEDIPRTASEYNINGKNGFYYRFVASCNTTPETGDLLKKLNSSIKTVHIK